MRRGRRVRVAIGMAVALFYPCLLAKAGPAEARKTTLSVCADPKLDAYVDSLIDKIGAAQEKDRYNRVSFKPVTTNGLRLEVTMQSKWSAGIQEWKVK